MIATISNEVPTGRSMKIRDGFMSRRDLLVGLGRTPGAAAAAVARRGARRGARAGARARARVGALLAIAAATLAVAGRRAIRRRRTLAIGRRGRDRRTWRSRRRLRLADLGAVAQAVGAV